MCGFTITKANKITYEDIKHFLTEEQREQYADPEDDFKLCIDRGIREANRTNFMTGIPKRSNGMQRAYVVIDALTSEEIEVLKTLPKRIKEANGAPNTTA